MGKMMIKKIFKIVGACLLLGTCSLGVIGHMMKPDKPETFGPERTADILKNPKAFEGKIITLNCDLRAVENQAATCVIAEGKSPPVIVALENLRDQTLRRSLAKDCDFEKKKRKGCLATVTGQMTVHDQTGWIFLGIKGDIAIDRMP